VEGLCDRVAALADRRVVAVGAPRALADEDGPPFVRQFFAGSHRQRGVS